MADKNEDIKIVIEGTLKNKKTTTKSTASTKTKTAQKAKTKPKKDNSKTTNKAKTKKDGTGKLLVSLSAISLVLLMVVVGQFFLINKDTESPVPRGTVINGIAIGGLNSSKATSLVLEAAKQKASTFDLTLHYGDKSWHFDKDDFVINSDIHTVIENIQNRQNINSSYENEILALDELKQNGYSFNLAFNYMFTGLDEKIENVIKEIEVPAQNSEIKFNADLNEPFEITTQQNGIRVDKAKLYKDINDQFLKDSKIDVEITTFEEQPTITQQDNIKMTSLLSTFKTNVSDSTGNRKHNVKAALSKFNGKIIDVDEVVSFNNVTGPHTLKNGYKVATIIYNGQYTDGVGGGICQASSTLYNALVLTGTQILEVHKHTLPVKYVPLGLDAMINEHTADLKFKNTTGAPLYIKTYSDANSVYVNIYGLQNSPYTYKTSSVTIKTIPHSGDQIIIDTKKEYTDKVLYQGEQFRLTYPRDGYEVKAYLQKYLDDKLVEETEIRHEIYYPQKGKIVEGSEVPPSGIDIVESDVDIIKSEYQSVSNMQ